MDTNQVEDNIQNEILKFLCSTIISIDKQYNFGTKLITNCPSFCFVDDDHYGEEIRKIDPNEQYTDDGYYKGIGKTIFKEGKNFVIIRSLYINRLIQSEYKNSICKHLIYHEIGHCITNIFNPSLRPPKKTFI